ncbi:hypothetical protein SCALM49S_08395 [Streptomyces californicus]
MGRTASAKVSAPAGRDQSKLGWKSGGLSAGRVPWLRMFIIGSGSSVRGVGAEPC